MTKQSWATPRLEVLPIKETNAEKEGDEQEPRSAEDHRESAS